MCLISDENKYISLEVPRFIWTSCELAKTHKFPFVSSISKATKPQ